MNGPHAAAPERRDLGFPATLDALVLEEFGNVIVRGGAGVVISSQSGHRLGALTAEHDRALATTPADDLLKLPVLQLDQVKDSLHAYQLAKRGNVLRVMARVRGAAWRPASVPCRRSSRWPSRRSTP